MWKKKENFIKARPTHLITRGVRAVPERRAKNGQPKDDDGGRQIGSEKDKEKKKKPAGRGAKERPKRREKGLKPSGRNSLKGDRRGTKR